MTLYYSNGAFILPYDLIINADSIDDPIAYIVPLSNP
jgi:hypothetical protein